MEISEQLVVRLSVAESTMDDAGEYAVRVYNEYGEVTSTTTVNILFEAPTFTLQPADQQVRQALCSGARTRKNEKGETINDRYNGKKIEV